MAATDSFIAEVLPGETFEVETELNIGGHLITSIDEKLTQSDVTLPFVNPATGPILIKRRQARRHADRRCHQCRRAWPWLHRSLAGHRHLPGLGAAQEFGIQNRNVRVENGIVHWSDTLKLEAKPMIGVIGVAPVAGGVLTIDNGTHGGNLDIQEVTNGNRVMFPRVSGGRLSLLAATCTPCRAMRNATAWARSRSAAIFA